MNRLKFLLLIFFLARSLAFSVSDTEKRFIKGNISEKITIIQNLKSEEIIPLSKKALDFSIENFDSLSADAELSRLAVAAVRSLPWSENEVKKIKIENRRAIAEKFMTVFSLFKNADLCNAIMERLPSYCLYDGEKEKIQFVDFLCDYLSTAYKNGEKALPSHEKCILLLAKTVSENNLKNNEALSIIFSIYASKIWPEYQTSSGEALIMLCADSFSDIIKIFSVSRIGDFGDFFLLLKNSSKITQNSLCDVAENALLIAINNSEKLRGNKEESEKFSKFQVDAQDVLCENKWSHAANVVNENIILAKKSYEKKEISESDFVHLIASSVAIPSGALVKTLTDFLSACNGKVERLDKIASGEKSEKNEMPAKSVVLALISALGELGDKTAFDTLLFVTYLNYPAEVIDEAKLSLAKLNW